MENLDKLSKQELIHMIKTKDRFPIGIKDSKGKMIREGDVLTDKNGIGYLVEWGEEEAGFYLYSNGNTHYFDLTDKILTIVGHGKKYKKEYDLL